MCSMVANIEPLGNSPYFVAVSKQPHQWQLSPSRSMRLSRKWREPRSLRASRPEITACLSSRPSQVRLVLSLFSECDRRDSNPQSRTGTGFQGLCVYQFRHGRVRKKRGAVRLPAELVTSPPISLTSFRDGWCGGFLFGTPSRRSSMQCFLSVLLG